jgi:hypothetical protein
MTFLTRDSSNHERIEQPSGACEGEQEQARACDHVAKKLWRVTDNECRWYNKLY